MNKTIIPGLGLVKELVIIGATSAFESVVLEKRIEGLPTKEAAQFVERLGGVRQISDYVDSALGQAQFALADGSKVQDVVDVLSGAVEKARELRDAYPVNVRELIQYSLSSILYNR